MSEIIKHGLAVTPFSFETNQLRVVTRDGEPWFVAADVCAALTLTNSRMALERLEKDEKGVSSIDTLGGTQKMIVIDESGLYSLVLGCRKPEAKRFKKWVTSEVLPSIRKTGSYSKPALSTMEILTLAMESEKGRLLAVEQRDHAIATKALIGSRREATAMATASAAVREVARLRDELGFGTRHATILQVENTTGRSFRFLPLRDWCDANSVAAESVPDKRYGSVKAWPAGAWLDAYSIDISKLSKASKA